MHGQQNFKIELRLLNVSSENVRQVQIWYGVS
jgi:hypothetical protein